MKKDNIALVGAGIGGRAILLTLLEIPSIRIKYVCDTNPEAPGYLLAKENKIECHQSEWPKVISADNKLDLIFEVTGKKEVFELLNKIKPTKSILIAAAGTKVIFHLLETQFKITNELREYKESLEQKIIERTKELETANRELKKRILESEKLNEQLQQVNNEKTKYILQSTHHLKAPFAAIQSYTELILEGYTGKIPDQTKNIIKKIEDRCELLSNSIKEMLELANLKTCIRNNLKMTQVGINGILEDTVKASSILASGKNIIIKFRKLGKGHIIKANREQMLILFSILLQNAIDYSFPNSSIEIRVHKERKNITIEIEDHGIGIPDKNITKIFDEYFRCNNAVSHNENGTGLGLAIAKEIVSIHSFKIDVKSKLNHGTTLFITIPLTE